MHSKAPPKEPCHPHQERLLQEERQLPENHLQQEDGRVQEGDPLQKERQLHEETSLQEDCPVPGKPLLQVERRMHGEAPLEEER